MSVYVDEFKIWPGARGMWVRGSSHLMADSEDELHAFAAKLGLQRRWFQKHPRHPHYDVVESKRTLALSLGAVFVPAMEQARARLEKAGILNQPASSREVKQAIKAGEVFLGDIVDRDMKPPP
jgi:hypothetical protein